jgi:hypothetical protein
VQRDVQCAIAAAEAALVRNWLGAEFRFTPPGWGNWAPAARAAVPATIPNMFRR